MLEELEMHEIKQGPYLGEADKTRFEGEIGEVKWMENHENI
jgi:mannose-6-phosphate isomerase-like protein (cupin superfamily)